MYISGELNRGIPCAILLHRFHIPRSLRMISAGDDQLGIRKGLSHNFERIEQELESLVGSPFAESQNPMLRISPPGKIRVLGFPRQNTVRSQMNIVTAIFFIKDLAIPRHENGNGIRQQENSGGK
jgi:hypothetical protein